MSGATGPGRTIVAASPNAQRDEMKVVRFVASGEMAIVADSDREAAESFIELVGGADGEQAQDFVDSLHIEFSGIEDAENVEFVTPTDDDQ